MVVLLTGGSGCGKSALAERVMREIGDRDRACFWRDKTIDPALFEGLISREASE